MHFRVAFDPGRALRSTWGLLARAPLLLAGALLVFLTEPDNVAELTATWRVDSPPDAVPRWSFRAPFLPLVAAWREWAADPVSIGAAVLAMGTGLFLGVVLLLLNTLLHAGLAGTMERAWSGGSTDLVDLLEPRGRFLPLLGTRILVYLIHFLVAAPVGLAGFLVATTAPAAMPVFVIACLLAWLPLFVFIALGLALAPKAALLEGLGPVDAVQRAWTLASGHRARLLIYYLALLLVTLTGVCLCCVGILLTGPWAVASEYESYLQLVRGAPSRDADAANLRPA